jgi:hypothetical protein
MKPEIAASGTRRRAWVALLDGQRILADRKSVPTSKKIRTALDRSSLKIIDPVFLVDQGERWAKLYEEIIVKGSR